MKKEDTFIMIKPDGIRYFAEIWQKIQECSKIIALKMKYLSEDEITAFSEEHKGKPFYDRLSFYLKAGPVILIVARGENVVDNMISLKTKIRESYGVSKTIDVLHSSDKEDAVREIQFFFKSTELLDYPEWDEGIEKKVSLVPDKQQLSSFDFTFLSKMTERLIPDETAPSQGYLENSGNFK